MIIFNTYLFISWINSYHNQKHNQMNKFFNSSKKTCCFKISVLYVICTLFLILPACQKTDFNQDLLKSSSKLPKKPKIKQEISDIEGTVYNTVKIGQQLWMAENLKSTKYNDGTDIPFVFVSNNSDFATLTTPGYCWYNNNYDTYGSTFGALYNWYAVNTGKLCPTGWHVPADAEWSTLTDYLGGEMMAGDKLKETGTLHWLSPNTGTNETGFKALPGGACYGYGPFAFIGEFGHWWSATELNASDAWYRWIVNQGSAVARVTYLKTTGYSVRCVKD